MLIVAVEEVRTGMKLAAPLQHPQNPQHELLKRGYALELSVVPRLQDLGVPFVYVDFPGLEDLDRNLAPRLSPERQAVYNQVKSAVTKAQGRSRPAVSYDDYYAVTRGLITTLLDAGGGGHAVYMDQMSAMGGDEVAHATAVAHLSLLLGLRLERYLIAQRKRLAPHHARDVVNLGVAAMLHDIGKHKLPDALRDRTGVEPPEDGPGRAEWETHARLGYEMLRGGLESSAASAVLHHHQHFDGTGFPARGGDDGDAAPAGAGGMVGQSIHVFARILQAADLYERLSLPRGAKVKRSNLEVHHLLRTRYAARVDPAVLRTLLSVTPPFMPGTKVTLSDGTPGVVVDVKAADPYAPIVRRLSQTGDALMDPAVALTGTDGLSVVTAGGVDVRPLLPESAKAA